jgi:hypothetical protein
MDSNSTSPEARSPKPLGHTILTLMVILSCAPIWFACTAEDPSPDQVRVYLEAAQTWAPVEAETERTIRRIFASQFVDVALVRREVSDCLQRLETHLGRVADWQTDSPELRRIHARYVLAWQNLRNGLQRLDHGISDGDTSDLAAGRRSMEEWRAALVDVAQSIAAARPAPPNTN